MAVRPLAAGMIRLHLEGADMGRVEAVRGGSAVGEVVIVRSGTELIGRKHVAKVRYEPIELRIGLSLDAAMYTWMAETLQGTVTQKSGVIRWARADGTIFRELEFEDAVITEVRFPAADASSKEAGFLTVQLQPTVTRMRRGAGNKITPGIGKKNFPASNFRFQMDGLDEASKRVRSVDAFTVKVKVAEIQSGAEVGVNIVPVGVEVSNLRVAFSESSAEEVYQWHEDFVIAGNNEPSDERSGSLSWLSADGKQVLMTLTFHHVGIIKLDLEEPGGDSVALVRAEMYVEQVELVVS